MTKKIFLILISLLICKIGMAQSRLSYTFDFEPIYSYRVYKAKDYSKETDILPSGKLLFDHFDNYYNETEKPGLGFGLTLGINYGLTDRLSFESGLGYKNIQEKLEYRSPEARYETGSILIPVYSLENKVEKIVNSFYYLTLPINFQYNGFSWGKLSFGLIIGSDIDFLLSSKLTNYSDGWFQLDPKYDYDHQISKIAVSLNGGLFLEYKIKNNLSIYIQPEFVRYITPNIQCNLQSYSFFYCKINQYNYYGQIKIGIKFKK